MQQTCQSTSLIDGARAEIAVDSDMRAMADAPSRVTHADDAGETEFAGDDRAVREHPAALDHKTRDQAEHRPPSRIGLASHEDFAPLKQSGVADVAENGRACID